VPSAEYALATVECGAGAGHRGLQHRFPVRRHKVRQYYPSLDAHKVIWRGRTSKAPTAPLLTGGKALAIR
jgi:hypothetical protein